jgi:hypothetical protein
MAMESGNGKMVMVIIRSKKALIYSSCAAWAGLLPKAFRKFKMPNPVVFATKSGNFEL